MNPIIIPISWTKNIDKADETAVFRVTFTMNAPPFYAAFYFDPDDFISVEDLTAAGKLPPLPDNSSWYVDGDEFDSTDITHDLDVIAGKRILFKEKDGTLVNTLTYSTVAQTVDLDMYMQYAEGGRPP